MPTILVVDDEPDICILLAEVLTQNGFSVLTAHDCAGAVSLLQSHHGEIELVITDVGMPDVDGPTFARALSMKEPDVPVLFMSGQLNPSELEVFDSPKLLTKPFSMEALLKTVRTLLPQSALGPRH